MIAFPLAARSAGGIGGIASACAVTNYSATDGQFTGRPWVLLHGNKLFVSYDDVPLPEDLEKIQAFVSIYELNPSP